MKVTDFYLFSIIIAFTLGCSTRQSVQFKPVKNSHIVILGNTFAERLQNYNYLEPLLYKSFPGLNITIRNMGWSADEVNLQPRPLNFGTLDEHLSSQKADIIFACFGLNEAFKGLDSLESFKTQLTVYLEHLMLRKYNGHSTPEIILVSPIAHENVEDGLPNPYVHNENLRLYTKAMEEVADGLGVFFIDLYNPTRRLMTDASNLLTINGIHLNDKGYKMVSEIIARSLRLTVSSWEQNENLINLKKIIDEKNQLFFYRFRAVNGEYIYGRRKEPWVQPPGGPISYPTEFKKLDKMILRLDTLIWAENEFDTRINLVKVQGVINDTSQFEPLNIREDTYSPPAADLFVLAPGFTINLFASEIDFPIGNPVAMTFDPRGRLWVSTMPSYPQYLPGSPPDDKIIILEDTDRDGKADKHTIFADSLYMPLGFELGDGGAYVTQAPNLVFLKDTNGDGKADFKEILLHGFGTEDIHHSISDYAWGPDGALYFQMGTFLHTQVETPYGPQRGAYGTTWRFEPRTKKLEPYISYPYANPWGNVFLKNGIHLIADVSTGMNYFAPPLTVATKYPKKHVSMSDFLTSKVKPKTCGMEIVSSSQFPDSVQGNVLFNTFIGFQGIRQHRISNYGSGIIGHETTPLLQSKDPNFRPVDLQFGPDGALYVVDWYNPIINHGERALRDPRRDHTHGRIWRITYDGKKLLQPLDLTRLNVDSLLDQLTRYEDRVRYRVRTQLREVSRDKLLSALEKWVINLRTNGKNAEQNKLEALWTYQQFDHPNEQLLDELLKAKDAYVRAAATRVLLYWKDDLADSESKMVAMSKDISECVRLQAIIGLSHFSSPNAVRALLATLELPSDYYIDYALKESFKHLKPIWMDMFKADRNFLANDSMKTRYLLLSIPPTLRDPGPGFLKPDPDWEKYAIPPLTPADFTPLSASVAVNRLLVSEFLNNRQQDSNIKRSPDNTKTIIQLETIVGKMAFDKRSIVVTAESNVVLLFDNPDGMAHNVVIIKPGSLDKVGYAADAMAKTRDGYEKNFIPDISEVLFATPLINAGNKYRLEFKAPSQPGDYPFICSFPGHWQSMQGIIKVVKSRPKVP